MTVKYYAILTNQGAARLANATMLGSKLNLTQMAVGDANGVLPTPDPAQTKLINQKRIAPLNLLSVDPNNQSQIIAEQIIPENEGGFWIREIGLYDDEGVLIAVANCPETYKPQLQEGSGRTQTIRMILVVTNTEAITLKIDPSVVLATRKYVDDEVLELKLYVDDQMRNHIAAQDPHTQYAQKHNPTFTGEPKAPTPAAGNNTTRIATTEFVQAAITALINGAPATLDTLKEIAAAINNDPKFSTTINNALALKAPLSSPALTGTPTAPTAAQSVNNTQIATTAFVKSAIAAMVGSAPAALDTLNELAAALGNDPNFSTTVLNALAGKQPLDNTLTNLSGKDVAGLLAYLGLGETINLAAGALQKSQNGGDIPDKKQFARTIGAVTSTTITLGESGWFKIATVVMPQATSTAVIKLYGGAGFNAGSPEQAAISELVLRAGNGSPVGITATLWRRSPAAANEVAWVNTSGDTYDIYINIGQYAYWLIAQYDYTGNANVTLHSTPEYSSVQPGNSTSGQTYTIYSSLMKPTAGDVGALPITGGQLNGPLSIGTDNALGGNSIVLGDNDTGFKQNGDGILDTYANNQHTVRVAPGEMMVLGAIRAGKEKKLSLTSNNNSTMTATFNLWGDANRPTVIELDDDQGWQLYSQRNPDGSVLFTVNGDITANVLRAGGAIYQNNGDIFGSLWGNGWLSTWINNNLVLDVQLGAGTSVTTWNNAGSWPNTPGYVVTSVWKDYQGENIDGINYAPLQKRVGNQWYTVQGGTV
ncbi:phage tail protein [Salmonella enterica subsp. enterica serovar Agona]|nr:phage tail protein [Salmonella enterica subsp. enterica serovar Agona]ECS9956653.1 phage tail protein [Salmonella enterica subsp. enterica serovar Agona]